jgi:hypothetical protein
MSTSTADTVASHQVTSAVDHLQGLGDLFKTSVTSQMTKTVIVSLEDRNVLHRDFRLTSRNPLVNPSAQGSKPCRTKSLWQVTIGMDAPSFLNERPAIWVEDLEYQVFYWRKPILKFWSY